MVVETIDIMQTQQIEDLQTDVEELKDKIALAVTDVNAITTKMNFVIDDLENLQICLMGTVGNQYSPSGTVDTDGLLKRIDELYAAFWDHIHMPPFAKSNQGYNSSHPPFQGGQNVMPTHATPVPNSLATVSQTPVSGYTATSSIPSGWADPVNYQPQPTKVAIVLGKTNETRARKLSRTIAKKVKRQWIRRKRRTYN